MNSVVDGHLIRKMKLKITWLLIGSMPSAFERNKKNTYSAGGIGIFIFALFSNMLAPLSA